MTIAYRSPAADRLLGILLTFLVHAALIFGWQMVRTLPRLPRLPSAGERPGIQWIPLPTPRAAVRVREAAPVPASAEPARARSVAPAALPSPSLPLPGRVPILASSPAAPLAAGTASQASAPAPSAGQILEQAKRDIGKIDKALRKENHPYIAAPLDSSQIRLRKGIELANELAPNRLWEAPKEEELVNNTGDGARRTRVITGKGTYCITERATNTDVEMIEHHGKLRITNCPAHEEPPKNQEWRTARD
jgi:hypothetical protein